MDIDLSQRTVANTEEFVRHVGGSDGDLAGAHEHGLVADGEQCRISEAVTSSSWCPCSSNDAF
jgi:hypothetical protein